MTDPHQPLPTPPELPTDDPANQESRLPVVSLIFGFLSLVQCLPFVGGVVAIITGVMGRRRAREADQPTSAATAGIWLGICGIAINVVLFAILVATGFAIFGVVSTQAQIAEQLKPAGVAAEAYGASNGTYRGLTLAGLERYGYVPVDAVTVVPVSREGGNSFCIEGTLAGEPDTAIHIPPLAGEVSIELNLGGSQFRYAMGPCPSS